MTFSSVCIVINMVCQQTIILHQQLSDAEIVTIMNRSYDLVRAP